MRGDILQQPIWEDMIIHVSILIVSRVIYTSSSVYSMRLTILFSEAVIVLLGNSCFSNLLLKLDIRSKCLLVFTLHDFLASWMKFLLAAMGLRATL